MIKKSSMTHADTSLAGLPLFLVDNLVQQISICEYIVCRSKRPLASSYLAVTSQLVTCNEYYNNNSSRNFKYTNVYQNLLSIESLNGTQTNSICVGRNPSQTIPQLWPSLSPLSSYVRPRSVENSS